MEEAVRQFRMREYWTEVDPEEGEARIENIETTIDAAKSIKGRPIDALAELKKTLKGTDEHGVTVSTIHGAKGLEWKHVVIAGCGAGILPYEPPRGKADEEEERRCMYVAVTRASDTLTISAPSFSKSRPLGPSPYVEDMRGVAVLCHKGCVV